MIDSCVFPEVIELVADAQYSLDIPNAGGCSSISEALSMQYMFYRYSAIHFLAEMEVPYWIDYKMCDYLMLSPKSDEWVGVSVTRAVNYPFDVDLTYEKAEDLVRRKLYGLVVAQEAVMEDYSFDKCILHVWCYNKVAALHIRQAFLNIRREDVVENTYDQVQLICTICHHRYIYTNRMT